MKQPRSAAKSKLKGAELSMAGLMGEDDFVPAKFSRCDGKRSIFAGSMSEIALPSFAGCHPAGAAGA